MSDVVVSKAKLQKMMEFVPAATANGNGQTVQDCYNALLAATTATEVMAVDHKYGGTLGYKVVSYLMTFVLMGETPPTNYFSNDVDSEPVQATLPEPTQEEDLSWITAMMAK